MSTPSNSTPDAPTPAAPAALPNKPGRSRNRLIALIVVAVVVVAAVVTTLVLTLGKDDAAASGRVTVTIGTTEEAADYWPVLTAQAAKQGIDIKLVNFNDYTQANPALAQGQLDLNLFQHLLFLANYNVEHNDTLTPIGSTVVVPLSLYSRKHTAVQQIPDGGTVAIPNDPTNQARALLVLQQAGLVKIKDGGSVLATPADLDTAASKVTIKPVDAAQTVASLPSVDAAIINNNFALDAKLDPTTAIYADDPSKPAAEPYINAFVSRAADADNPTYVKIVQLYHETAVTDAVLANSKGTAKIIDRPKAELATILSGLQSTVQKSGA